MIEQTYRGVATPKSAREFVKDISLVFRQHSLDPETAYELELAITEACANVVLHAYAESEFPGEIEVTLILDWYKAKVKICDWGMPFSGPTDELYEFRPEDESGRGIFLISQLVDNFYFENTQMQNILILEKKLEEHVWKH